MREIVFDTETTGLDQSADRVIEIGCVELLNHIPSGETFQAYINPGRSISVDSYRIHGLSESFLADKPTFASTAEEFLGFIRDSPLIAHNAEFDLAFVNAELGRIGRAGLDPSRVIDSLVLARRRHPAGPNSLDALCARYGVNASDRTLHGALIDALLLAEVYIELIGGRQATLQLGDAGNNASYPMSLARLSQQARPVPLPSLLGGTTIATHGAFVALMKGGGIWSRYRNAPRAPAG
ncbi:MAG: DNA polymerase III subunit epsilon [Alphaproteobacteria bacterium]